MHLRRGFIEPGVPDDLVCALPLWATSLSGCIDMQHLHHSRSTCRMLWSDV